ncbi:Disks large 5 [Tyrophagus putrescentiae]|nr:Disks large 5 [Tyrophagus putrescentiae]
MFSEINGQPLMQHGPYGAALLDFTATPPTAAAASAVSHQSPSSLPITPVSPVSPPYHPHPPHHPLSTISQTERLLIQENLLLRQSCQQLMVQVDQLNRNRDYLNTQFTTFHLLYVQQKQDRARLARQLTSTQRELEHLKRAQVNGNARSSANGRGGPGNRSWRRTQSAKYHGSGGSTSTIDQQESAAAQAKPTSSTYRRYDELNEEDHKTPVMSPSAMATNSPPVFPAGFTHDDQQMTFVQCEIPSIVSDVDAVQVQGQDQTLAQQQQQQQQPIPCSSDDDGEIDGSSGSGGDGPEEEGSPKKKKKSTKLVYRDSLRQCVEFSRSLLDLSRRHIVGAEKDELENDNDAADGDDHNESYLQDEAENSGEANFLLTYEALEHQKEKELVQKQVEAIVPIEEAIPMIDEPVEPQCSQFLQIECAPITFTSTAPQSPQSPPELSSSPVDTTTSTTTANNNNNNNLVVNLSYVSDDLPATYLREVRLPNKPARQFLGIFFEGAFSSGVVVQQVVPGSVAARAGISPGDRVLEICGINMRTANYRLASRVLAQCETDTVCFKVVSSEAAHRGFPQRTDGAQQQQFRSAAAAVAGHLQSDHNEMAEMTHSNNATAPDHHHHHQFLLLCSQASTSSSGTSATSATSSSSSTGSAVPVISTDQGVMIIMAS